VRHRLVALLADGGTAAVGDGGAAAPKVSKAISGLLGGLHCVDWIGIGWAHIEPTTGHCVTLRSSSIVDPKQEACVFFFCFFFFLFFFFEYVFVLGSLVLAECLASPGLI
jgi:hypothetical protein